MPIEVSIKRCVARPARGTVHVQIQIQIIITHIFKSNLNACLSIQSKHQAKFPWAGRAEKEISQAHGHAPMTFDTKLAVQHGQTMPLTVTGTVTETGNRLSDSGYHAKIPGTPRTLSFCRRNVTLVLLTPFTTINPENSDYVSVMHVTNRCTARGVNMSIVGTLHCL